MQVDYQFAYAAGQAPQARGLFKQQPEDFQVVEELGFDPEQNAAGQHHWLWVEKRGANTDFVAKQIARFVGVAAREVGYSGIKDRHAVTQQWFSVQLPATREVDWSTLQQDVQSDEFRVLRTLRCERKLRRGSHRQNTFKIRLRNVEHAEQLEQALQRVAAIGVPNYFGEQRFGHQGKNIEKALAMFAGKRIKDRNQRSLLLSAARSYIFNHYLSERIAQGHWQTPWMGDLCMLGGTQSFFLIEELDETLQQRLEEHDIELSGPLWGRGQRLSDAESAQFEARITDQLEPLCSGLEKAGLKQERRALRLMPTELTWAWQGADCVVQMALPAGTYATSVLRELVDYSEQQA